MLTRCEIVRTRLICSIVGLGVAAVVSPTSVAFADVPCKAVYTDGKVTCEVEGGSADGGQTSGSGGTSNAGQGSTSNGPVDKCAKGGGKVYLRQLDPQPSPGAPVWGGHTPDEGAIWITTSCDRASGVNLDRETQEFVPNGAADTVPVITPAMLLPNALAELKPPAPTPGQRPWRLQDGRPFTLVKAPTWYWTDSAMWLPMTGRAEAGGVWAEATATPTQLRFLPGDGSAPVSCVGPGSVWATSAGPYSSSPSGCDYSYPHSTYGMPGGVLTATWQIVWTVTWLGSDGSGGTLDSLTTESQATFAVAEAQSVVVN